jgi:hypothetical protein
MNLAVRNRSIYVGLGSKWAYPEAIIKGMMASKMIANFHPNQKPMAIAPNKVTTDVINTGSRVNT